MEAAANADSEVGQAVLEVEAAVKAEPQLAQAMQNFAEKKTPTPEDVRALVETIKFQRSGTQNSINNAGQIINNAQGDEASIHIGNQTNIGTQIGTQHNY